MMTKVRKKKTFVGKVFSNKMNKTIMVQVERTFRHPRFGKTLRRTKKFKVHDEHEKAKTGDTVMFYEGRPISKTKYMYLDCII